MALEIFKLVGSVFVDTDKANESLAKTDKKALSVAEGLGKVAGVVTGVATAVIGTATAVGGAVMDLANDFSAQADEIDKASIRMGITAEKYQELSYAAGQCGVEMSTMEQAAKKLEGTNINFDDAINSIMELGTAEERSAKAAELFGDKIAYNLSPLIEQSGEDFNGLIDRANELGLVMSGDAVKAGVEFGDLMSDLQQTFDSLKNQLGAAVLPTLNEFLKAILENVPTLQAMLQEFLPPISDFMVSFIPQMMEMSQQLMPVTLDFSQKIFSVLFDLITTLMPVALELSSALLPVMITIIQTLLPVLLDTINALLPLITALLPLVEPMATLVSAILVPLAELLSSILPPLIEALVYIIEGVMPGLIAVVEFTADFISDVLNRGIGLLKPTIDSVIGIFQGLGDFLTGVFTGNWELAFNGIWKIFKNIINLIIHGLTDGLVNAFIETVNVIIRTAAKLVDAIPGVNIDVDKVEIPKVNIPLLAKGGIVTEEGSAIVGESGAELLNLPKGASVTPLPKTNSVDDMKEAFIEALNTVGLTIKLEADTDGLFNMVVKQNTTYKQTHGGLSAI